jgi:hypothetical protein
MDQSAFMTGLENQITNSGYKNGIDPQDSSRNILDPRYFDKKLLDALWINSISYAKRVEAGGLLLWQQEHNALLNFLGSAAIQSAYAVTMWASGLAYSSQQVSSGSYQQDYDDALIGASNKERTGGTGNATADVRKFSEYIFKDGAAPGKDIVFKELGYTANDSQMLTDLYKQQAATKYAANDYTLGRLDSFGQRINIEIELNGVGNAAGKTSYIKSGWMIQPDGSISLNTPFTGFTR